MHKVNLDTIWLKYQSLEDMDNLPDLESALDQFRAIYEDLEKE